MSNYLNYPEESTNIVKSRKKLSMIILAAVYLGVWAVFLISFWFFGRGSDAMGYSIMCLWILLPCNYLHSFADHRKERLLGTEKMAYCPRIWTDVYACGIWDIQCGQYDYVSKNQSAGIYYDTNRYNGFSDRNGNRHGNPPCAQSNKEEMKESEKKRVYRRCNCQLTH